MYSFIKNIRKLKPAFSTLGYMVLTNKPTYSPILVWECLDILYRFFLTGNSLVDLVSYVDLPVWYQYSWTGPTKHRKE